VKLGSTEIQSSVSRLEVLTMLLWGKPGVGKTVLAATAPGKKLWLQFDPSGTASLTRSEDILVADFSGFKPAQLASFKQGGIIEADLAKTIRENEINTVVCDSLTSFGQMALSYAVVSGKGNRGDFKASLEQPGQTGYGVRSAMVIDFVTMVMRVCADAKVHCIFTAHDQENMDKEGKITEITLSLGGQGKSVLPAKISEIWHIEDTGRARIIYVRAHGIKTPMRTRMFLAGDKTFFVCKYDQTKSANGDNNGIAQWYEAWKENGFNKTALPNT
jgi:hypothetical protein